MRIEVSVTAVDLIRPQINIIASVPASFNGLGLREEAFMLMFIAVGVSDGCDAAAALIDGVTAMSMSLLDGLFDQHTIWRYTCPYPGYDHLPAEYDNG